MHEINDVLTPKELKALTLREAGYTFIKMKKEFDVSATGVARYYQRARRKQEKWIEYNATQSALLLKLLLPIKNEIKELRK